MRKFLVALILLIGVIFIVGRLSEVESIIATLQRGDWRFISLAFLLLAGVFITNGALYQAVFRSLGIEEKLKVLVPLSACVFFVNMVAPSVGVSGIALLIAEARKRNFSPARATVANALFIEFDNISVMIVVATGFLVLFRRNNLSFAEITAALFLFLAMVVLGFLLVLGMRSAEELGQALAWLTRLVNKLAQPFIHHPYLSEEYALRFAHDAAEGLHEFRKNPRLLVTPVIIALINKLVLLLILLSVFQAFKVPISLGTVVASLSLSLLFVIVSPTPAGLGVVEGTLTLALTGMYISLEDAVVIIMAYRGLTFWAPMLFGMLAFHRISRERGLPVPANQKGLSG